MKKLTILLLILTLLFQLTACVTPDDTSAETTEKPIPDNIPSELPGHLAEFYDPDGDTPVEFIYVEGGLGTYVADSLTADLDGGYLDDADMGIIERNNRVKEYLGVTVEAFTDETLGVDQLHTLAKFYFDSQDPTLDVYVGVQYYDLSVATSGHLLDLGTLKNYEDKPIIDTEKEYWATEHIEAINPGGATYFVTGDLSLTYAGGFYCTFVNEYLYDLYVKESYGDLTIHELADQGRWTMETMLDMASLVYDDTDKSETTTETDRLGIVYEPGSALDGFAYGCNVSFSRKGTDSSGKAQMEFTLGTDENANKLAGYLKTVTSADYTYNAGAAGDQNMMPIFAAGNTLFCFSILKNADVYLRDMDNYEILPYPKLDGDQTGYFTGLDEAVSVYGISRYSDCPRLAAATLELMASLTRNLSIRHFYDKFIPRCRCAHPNESQIVADSFPSICHGDFAAAWGNSLGNVNQVFRDPAAYTDFSDYVKTHYPDTETKMNEILRKLTDTQ